MVVLSIQILPGWLNCLYSDVRYIYSVFATGNIQIVKNLPKWMSDNQFIWIVHFGSFLDNLDFLTRLGRDGVTSGNNQECLT